MAASPAVPSTGRFRSEAALPPGDRCHADRVHAVVGQPRIACDYCTGSAHTTHLTELTMASKQEAEPPSHRALPQVAASLACRGGRESGAGFHRRLPCSLGSCGSQPSTRGAGLDLWVPAIAESVLSLQSLQGCYGPSLPTALPQRQPCPRCRGCRCDQRPVEYELARVRGFLASELVR